MGRLGATQRQWPEVPRNVYGQRHPVTVRVRKNGRETIAIVQIENRIEKQGPAYLKVIQLYPILESNQVTYAPTYSHKPTRHRTKGQRGAGPLLRGLAPDLALSGAFSLGGDDLHVPLRLYNGYRQLRVYFADQPDLAAPSNQITRVHTPCLHR